MRTGLWLCPAVGLLLGPRAALPPPSGRNRRAAVQAVVGGSLQALPKGQHCPVQQEGVQAAEACECPGAWWVDGGASHPFIWILVTAEARGLGTPSRETARGFQGGQTLLQGGQEGSVGGTALELGPAHRGRERRKCGSVTGSVDADQAEAQGEGERVRTTWGPLCLVMGIWGRWRPPS